MTCGSVTPLSPSMVSRAGRPQLPRRAIDLGIRNDLQLRGIKPYQSGEFQVGFQYIANFSDDKDATANPSRTADGASRCDTCRSCSAAITSSFSNTARAGVPASERLRAFITPTSRSARTQRSHDCESSM